MKKKFISVLLCGAMTASLFGMGAMAEETKTFTVGLTQSTALWLHGR